MREYFNPMEETLRVNQDIKHGDKINKKMFKNLSMCTYLFNMCDEFNDKVDVLDTTRVKDMDNMFHGCKKFNQPIEFSTESLLDAERMFDGCKVFNQPVHITSPYFENASYMFSLCDAFNQPVNIDSKYLYDTSFMFHGCYKFNQPITFHIDKDVEMSAMFIRCYEFNQPITFYINEKKCNRIFKYCRSFNQELPKKLHDKYVVDYCSSFNQPMLCKKRMGYSQMYSLKR